MASSSIGPSVTPPFISCLVLAESESLSSHDFSVTSHELASLHVVSRPITKVHGMQTCLKLSIVKPKCLLSLSVSLAEDEPSCVSKASKSPHWKHAMAGAYNALMANNT